MKRFTITIISAMLCGLVVLSACGGAKKNVQDAEGQAEAGGNVPGGYLMPAISANNFVVIYYHDSRLRLPDARKGLVP